MLTTSLLRAGTQTVSFMTEEAGLTHQDPMPDVPPPERIKSLLDTYKDLVSDDRIPPKIKSSLSRSLNFPFPIDLRQVTPTNLEERLGNSLPPVQRSWFRVQGHLGNSLMLHQCALAYLSDWSLLGTSLLPHKLHHWVPKDSDTVLQMASIDHSMWSVGTPEPPAEASNREIRIPFDAQPTRLMFMLLLLLCVCGFRFHHAFRADECTQHKAQQQRMS